MSDRRVDIEGRWDGKKLEKGFDKSGKKLQSAAKKTGEKMSGFVGKETGQALSQFNEKTEKGRQLLNAFGGAMGGVAGEAVYYGGTLSYVFGRFSKLEMGIMGGIAALTTLGYLMYKQAAGPYKELREETEKLRKETDKLRKSISDFVETEMMTAAGWTRYDKKSLEVKKKIQEQRELELKYVKQIEEIGEASNIYQAKLLEDAEKGLRQVRTQIVLLQGDLAEIAKAEVVTEKAKELKTTEKPKAGTRAKIAEDVESGWNQNEEWREIQEARLQDTLRYAQEEERIQDWLMQNREARASKAARIEERKQRETQRIQEESLRAQWEQERQAAEARVQIASQGIELFEELGTVIAQNEKQRTAVKIAAIIAEAAVQSTMEMARGFASLATPWLAAAHFTAAGLYAAVAAGKVAGAAGGGGGGGGAAGPSMAERMRRQEDRQRTREEKGEVHIHIGEGGIVTSNQAMKEIERGLRDLDERRGGSRERNRVL